MKQQVKIIQSSFCHDLENSECMSRVTWVRVGAQASTVSAWLITIIPSEAMPKHRPSWNTFWNTTSGPSWLEWHSKQERQTQKDKIQLHKTNTALRVVLTLPRSSLTVSRRFPQCSEQSAEFAALRACTGSPADARPLEVSSSTQLAKPTAQRAT